MPETTAFGAPQEQNRRSFSLAVALQMRVDQQNEEISGLQKAVHALCQQAEQDAKTLRWYVAGIQDIQALAIRLKIARKEESYKQMIVRLAVEAGYVTPEDAAEIIAVFENE